MKYVEVIADTGNTDTILAIAEKIAARDVRLDAVAADGTQLIRILVADDKLQAWLDTLQHALGTQTSVRILVMPVDIVLPKPPDKDRREEDSAIAAREALYDNVEKNARLDQNYIVLVVLSTVVAAIGLVENNVAVVIGAMVIAPLLGPNLAFGFGTALGDISLMKMSALSAFTGIALAVVLSVAIGAYWPFEVSSPELIARTHVGFESAALALAAGAAASLSLTTGLSSVLVGVMVAVALLPPATALGLLLGQGEADLAVGAGLLLAINVVCVNLASKVVFFLKGIRPRSWWEKEKSRRAMIIYTLIWVVTLILLASVIYGRRVLTGT